MKERPFFFWCSKFRIINRPLKPRRDGAGGVGSGTCNKIIEFNMHIVVGGEMMLVAGFCGGMTKKRGYSQINE